MPTRVYKSIAPGAPVLRGSVGSLIEVLRACLVDGYGSLAPAGWSMPYTDGQTPPQRAHFRQAPRTGWPQCDLQVDDDITTSDSGWDATHLQRIARIAGWTAATGLGVGSGRFPSDGSTAPVPKGSDATTARPWVVVANERGFLMWCGDLDPRSNGYVFFFGDLIPHVASDTLAVGLLAAGGDKYSGSLLAVGNNGLNVAAGSWTGGSSAGLTKVMPVLSSPSLSGTYGSSGLLQWPNPSDGKGYMNRLLLLESNTLRAILPGFWVPLHNWVDAAGVQRFSEFTGSGNLAGRSFIIIKAVGASGYPASRYAVAFETSDTWYVA
jgi:hypothetical protein